MSLNHAVVNARAEPDLTDLFKQFLQVVQRLHMTIQF